MIAASIKVLFLFCVGLSLLPVVGQAQQSANTRKVLLLNWYDKDDFANVRFDAAFQTTLQSAGTVELYTEFLESNRFPKEDQALALHDYLKRKYADRFIDVIVANSDASLNFFLKHRSDLFPQTPIVFVATRHPSTIYDQGAFAASGSVRVYARSCVTCHSAIHGSNHPSGQRFIR